MTDKELLELAAKAAGIEHKYWDGKSVHWPNKGFYRIDASGTPTSHHAWNPLTDDGDALRLAVKLHIGVAIESYAVRAYTRIRNTANVAEYTNADYSVAEATRRAIVRAAAEIGKGMK